MYGKIFDSIYDGTLVEDWRALVTFQQLIVLCDRDGTIDMTPSAIARRTGIPIEHIKAGLEILESPDPYSRTSTDEGRRIERLDDHRPWGWSIVNHSKYRNLASQADRRSQNRKNKQAQRERQQASSSVSNGQRSSAMSAHTDTDTDTDTENLNPGAWDLYLTHRKELRKNLTDRGKKMAAKKLAELSHEDQMRAVEITIENGWTGLFPEKVKTHAASRDDSFQSQLSKLRVRAGLDPAEENLGASG